MNVKKIIAKQILEDSRGMELTKKELDDGARVMAHECEEFADMIFEVGVKEIFKEYKKLRRKDSESDDDADTTGHENSDYPLKLSRD